MKGEFFSSETVYKNSKPHVRLFGRWEDQTKMDIILKGDSPYFFVLASEKNLIPKRITYEEGYKSLYKEDLIKVFITNYKDQKEIPTIFSKTYEADLKYTTRYLIDNDIYTSINKDDMLSAESFEGNPRVCLVDIETDYKGGSNKDMSKRIISISFYDNYTNKFYSISFRDKYIKHETRNFEFESEVLNKDKTKKKYICEEYIVLDELELLEKFKQFVIGMDFDLFTGWNVNFDMVYILRRLEVLNLNPESLSPLNKYYYATEHVASKAGKKALEKKFAIQGRACIDLMKGYKRLKWKQVPSYALDEVGRSEFNISKIEYNGWMSDFWKTDFDHFLRYNRRDLEICLAINQQYTIIDFLLNMRRITGCQISDTGYNSRMIDIYILRKTKNKFKLPSKTYFENPLETAAIEGGFVLDPIVGIHDNVASLDMKSLYPSIMLALNMSPETISKDGEIKCENGICFTKETGILKEILMDLLSRRDDIRAKLKTPEITNNKTEYLRLYKYQYAYKTFTNSLYGVTLFKSFRLFNPDIGSSITFTGRFLAHKIKEYCNELGYKVVRQDTDSAFVKFENCSLEESIKLGLQLEKDINKMFKVWLKTWNCDISYFSIKFEKLYGMLFSGSEKKLYGGKITWDWEQGLLKVPEIEIKGFAAKRSDRSIFSRKLQQKVFEMIFERQSSDDILKYIYKEIDNIFDKKYSYEIIGLPKAISKDLLEYKNKNPWVKGVEFSQKHISGYVFSPKPLLIYIKKTNTYKSESVCFNNSKEFESLDVKIDWERMIMASVYNITKSIVPLLNLSEKDIKIYLQLKCNHQKTLSNW